MAPMATSSELHVPALALAPLPVFHFLWALKVQFKDFPPFCPLPHTQLTTDIVTSFLQGSGFSPSSCFPSFLFFPGGDRNRT